MDIKEARKQLNGVTRPRAAKWFGLNPRTLESWETGARPVPAAEEQRLLEGYQALTICTQDFFESLDDGDSTIEQAVWAYKIDQVKKISRIGRYGETFNRNWALIPVEVKKKCSAEELAEIVDALYLQYKAGQDSPEE